MLGPNNHRTIIQFTSITTRNPKQKLSIKDKIQITIANINWIFIDGVVTDHTINTHPPYEINRTNF